ncbi:cob(I)yrinic acid a,c-diamide adenosyltransferase [Pseudomonadota bacterium]
MASDTEESKNERHRQRMQRQKEVVDASIARADEDRGIIVVNTGNGKGKSSSGFGVVARALGHGMRVAVVQFIKGRDSTGEERFFRQFPAVEYHVMGEGFTWETQDRERDIAAAEEAWQKSCEFLASEEFDLVMLDELNIALKLKYLDVNDVVKQLQKRPRMQHVVITGRAAPDELIEVADTVTEMREIKHAYKAGVRAQKGIEM